MCPRSGPATLRRTPSTSTRTARAAPVPSPYAAPRPGRAHTEADRRTAGVDAPCPTRGLPPVPRKHGRSRPTTGAESSRGWRPAVRRRTCRTAGSTWIGGFDSEAGSPQLFQRDGGAHDSVLVPGRGFGLARTTEQDACNQCHDCQNAHADGTDRSSRCSRSRSIALSRIVPEPHGIHGRTGT